MHHTFNSARGKARSPTLAWARSALETSSMPTEVEGLSHPPALAARLEARAGGEKRGRVELDSTLRRRDKLQAECDAMGSGDENLYVCVSVATPGEVAIVRSAEIRVAANFHRLRRCLNKGNTPNHGVELVCTHEGVVRLTVLVEQVKADKHSQQLQGCSSSHRQPQPEEG